MNPPIARQLRVKGGGENSVLTDQHRVIAPAPEHLDGFLAPRDSGGADEGPLHMTGIAEGRREIDLGNRRKDLPSVGVPLDIDRQHSEAGLRRHYRPGEEYDTRAGRENCHARPDPFSDPTGELFGFHQPKHRR